MMLEEQYDGLRITKGPQHYYGSDPYDTFRGTRALSYLGHHTTVRRILERQLGRLCKNGMWQGTYY